MASIEIKYPNEYLKKTQYALDLLDKALKQLKDSDDHGSLNQINLEGVLHGSTPCARSM